ncbi:hypothetical protein NDU88_003085 [Pleurodeles waltl]|uniref:Uncharacterized protein n=1 Tax=Pleurodeles waltl TaxID=8319 RepID=A0AAV7QER9_PLEWA|nr:hypothetical protein NDU88_003085 [Pleurodeles waltl]
MVGASQETKVNSTKGVLHLARRGCGERATCDTISLLSITCSVSLKIRKHCPNEEEEEEPDFQGHQGREKRLDSRPEE